MSTFDSGTFDKPSEYDDSDKLPADPIIVQSNVTPDGNPAIRRGAVVPPGAVNLAWAKTPQITPQDNLIIIDTSNVADGNVNTSVSGFYYADEMGVLQDINGNQLFQDAHPRVTDQFTVEGDLTDLDLSQDKVFPFKHVSRYFHVDFTGLTHGSDLTDYVGNLIKVTDTTGRIYVDGNGLPRYKVMLTPALSGAVATEPNLVPNTMPTLNSGNVPQQRSLIGNEWPYRVYVYVDDDTREDLLLTYNKIDISADGHLIDQEINYTEILNPIPAFEFRPEVAEVVDLVNRDMPWYSSQDASYASQALGNTSDVNGYKIFAPKKALNDPRIFQSFQWRVTCNFTENITVDTDVAYVNVGVIVTSCNPTSPAAQAWSVLQGQGGGIGVNKADVTFRNPLQENVENAPQQGSDAYWYVNFDTITNTELQQFDALIWVPPAGQFDFTPYLPHLNYFTRTLGKFIFIDTASACAPENLGLYTSAPVNPATGTRTAPPPGNLPCPYAHAGPAYTLALDSEANATILIDAILAKGPSVAKAALDWPYPTVNGTTYSSGMHYMPSALFDSSASGGWAIPSTEPISNFQTLYGEHGAYTQYLVSYPNQTEIIALASLVCADTLLDLPFCNNAEWNIMEYVTSFGSIAGPVATMTDANFRPPTVSAPVPTLVTGQLYDRTEVVQDITFTGSTGGTMATVLSGGSSSNGFNDITRTATVASGTNSATISGVDSCVDPTTLGTYVNLVVGTVSEGSGNQNIMSTQSLRATVFYHKDTTITQVIQIKQGSTDLINFPALFGGPTICKIGTLFFSTLDILGSAASGLTGAMQFLYNFAMQATALKALPPANVHGPRLVNRQVSVADNTFASSYSFSSPWALSWTINTTDNPGVLTNTEKTKYDFVYLPEDAATPTLVWQRQLSNRSMRELVDEGMSPDQLTMIANSTRNYVIEVTSSNVNVPTTLTDDSLPYAWTWAYTPAYTVPPDYTSYIIQEKEIPAQYEAGQYVSRSYPAKPYSFQVTASYDSSLTGPGSVSSTDWTAFGTATLTWDTETWVPPVTTLVPVTTSTTITIPHTSTVLSEVILDWKDTCGSPYYTSSERPYSHARVPWGLFFWQQFNYLSGYGNQLNWAHNGFTGRYGRGASGAVVSFLQDCLNRVGDADLRVDGDYGDATYNAVCNFQRAWDARYIDGDTDAEMWSLLGGQIIRHGLTAANTGIAFYSFPYTTMDPGAISNNDPSDHFIKRSWGDDGPCYIWEIFSVYFGPTDYSIHEIDLIPYLEGSTNSLLWSSAHVMHTNDPDDQLIDFNPSWMSIPVNRRCITGQLNKVAFSPRQGNFIMVMLAQDRPGYSSSNRMLGVADLRAKATVPKTITTYTTSTSTTTTYTTTTVTPGYCVTTVNQATVNISATGTINNVLPNIAVTATAVPQFSGVGTLSNVVWLSVEVANPAVVATIARSGLITFVAHTYATSIGQGVEEGPIVPSVGEVWYSKDINGNLRPYPETGWVSKPEGIKLLCAMDGSPFGLAGFSQASQPLLRSYSKINMVRTGTDPTVRVGFYDINRKEFIVNASGAPEVAYVDYIMRNGWHNIYVAVVSTYEDDVPTNLPTFQPTQNYQNTDDAPMLPQLLTLPVYGVKTTPYNKISLAPLPPNLGPDDIWPVAVRAGQFVQPIAIPVGVTTEMSPYVGTTVTAFYDVPEAQLAPWSSLFGPPNVDVLGETPMITDDNVIQVRQTPILMQQFPTINPGPADPVIPIFTVHQRASLTSPWVQLSPSQIADYNVSTGEITLQNIAWANDPNMFRVDYTSQQDYYYFKQYGGNPINLNPYPDESRQYVNQSLYIYVLPHFVRDQNQSIISAVTQTRTLRFTTDPSIFNPTSSSYDPLAFQLGIVRVTTNVDIQDLVLLDSRQRGGGVPCGVAAEQVIAMLDEARNYWDIGYSGSSYQNSGFVIIRLPATLKEMYTDAFINEVIRDNLTAGVEFKIEDTEGNPW